MSEKNFDVIVTTNLYGDIISDVAAEISGSVGLAGSANIGQEYAMFEAIHGSAPDIAGTGKANPLAEILSLAMLLRYTLGENKLADMVEQAVNATLISGLRTADISDASTHQIASTTEMGAAVIQHLKDSN